MSEIGMALGVLKAGYAIVQYVNTRGGFAPVVAKEVVKAVPSIRNQRELAEFLKQDDVHLLLIAGPEDGEEELAARLVTWLSDGTGRTTDDEGVQAAAREAARSAMYAYVAKADDETARLLQDFRQRQTIKEIRDSFRAGDARPRTEGLPPRTGSALLAASPGDVGAATALADLLHRDESPESLAYDAAELVLGHTGSPAFRHLVVAAAEFASAHTVQDTFRRLVEVLVERRTPEAASLLVRVALNAPDDEVDGLLDRAADLAPSSRGPDIVRADRAEKWDEVLALVPADTTDPLGAMFLARALVHLHQNEKAVRVLDHAAANAPANASLLTKAAGLRLTLYGTEFEDGQIVAHEPQTLAQRETLERARREALSAVAAIRRWKGNASEPLTVAVQASVRLMDPEGAIEIVRSADGAGLLPEAASPEVAAAVAGAAAMLRDHATLEEVIQHVPKRFHRDMVLGLYHTRLGGASDVAIGHYEAALECAEDSAETVRALLALANEQVPLPADALEQVRVQLPDEATLVEAVAALSGDDNEAVLRHLEQVSPNRRADPQVVALRAEALIGMGHLDDAIGVLERAAEASGDVMFLSRGMTALTDAGQATRAMELGERHLDRLQPAEQARLRAALMELAAESVDWQRLERHATAALASGQLHPSQGRWALIQSYWNQGKHKAAYEVLADGPLEPHSEIQVRVELALRGKFGQSADDVKAILDAGDAYPESEEIRAAVLHEFMMMRSRSDMPTTALGRFRQQLQRFQEDFPDSERIVAIPVSDDIQEIKDFMRTNAMPPAVLNVARQIFVGRLPVGMASAIGSGTYLEALITPPPGYRLAANNNPNVAAAEDAAARNATESSSAVVVDLSTLVLLVVADIDPDAVFSEFPEVIVAGDAARDAEMGRVSLDRRPTMFTGVDDSGALYLNEISTEEADRRADIAARVKQFLDRRCTVVEPPPDDNDDERDWPFLSSLRIAEQRRLPLVADDVPVRQLATSEGVTAFGSLALLAVQGRYDAEVEAAFRRIGVADLPFDIDAYLRLAAEDEWIPGVAAIPLLRPTSYGNHQYWRRYLGECLASTSGDKPQAAAGWTRAAAIGFTGASDLSGV